MLIFNVATTENPSLELNNAVLSRCRVYVLRSLQTEHVRQVLELALSDAERGLGADTVCVEESCLDALAKAADGDARKALNLLEIANDLAEDNAKDRKSVV